LSSLALEVPACRGRVLSVLEGEQHVARARARARAKG
jgi:hypothetical protein